jgi:hypothetical protein
LAAGFFTEFFGIGGTMSLTRPSQFAQLGKLAEQAKAEFVSLLAAWNWAEINQPDNDKVRRLLVWAVPWASDIADKSTRLNGPDAAKLLASIDALQWAEKALAARDALRACVSAAISMAPSQRPPTLNEMDLFVMTDQARILLTVCAAERALALLPKRGMTSAHQQALRNGIDFAKAIGEQRSAYLLDQELPLLNHISALHWPGRSAAIASAVGSCVRAASNPWLDEQSAQRTRHLVDEIDLQGAVKAGVKQSDLGSDYLALIAQQTAN